MYEARRMTRATRAALGLITLLPLAVTVWWLVETLLAPGAGLVAALGLESGRVLTLMLPFMVLAVLVFYFPALLANRAVPREERWLWGVGFVLLGLLVVPAYWWLHVWNEPYDLDPPSPAGRSRPMRS